MGTTPTADLRAWLGEASGADALSGLDTQWEDFASTSQPVVTLFGAYDTGKSSILRRLLVDAGQPIPDWLGVSARHETAVSSLVEVSGCLLRDTPGLSPGGDDVRSLKNSDTARASLGLTDVLLITTNPQLPTGERPELLSILSDGWPASSVWFLISRADEGTIDPAIDRHGFEEWAESKRNELRASLSLKDAHPIRVVVPDYGQLGSFESEPTPATWAGSREWDGMDLLREALANLSSTLDLGDSRAHAQARFWRTAVALRLTELRVEVADIATSHDVAAVSLRRSDVFLKSLDALVAAAEVSLEGAIDSGIRRAMNNPLIDATTIKEAVDPVLSEWWHSQQAQLARIRQDAIHAFDTERSGRGWATFESLYSTFNQPGEASEPQGPSFTPHFESLGKKAADALRAIDKVRAAHEATKRPSEAAGILDSALTFGQAADLVNAALPLLTELASLIEDKVVSEAEKAREQERRTQVTDEVTRIVKGAAEQALKNLEPDVLTLRDEITGQTIGRGAVDELEQARIIAGELVRRGESLLVEASASRPQSQGH